MVAMFSLSTEVSSQLFVVGAALGSARATFLYSLSGENFAICSSLTATSAQLFGTESLSVKSEVEDAF
jgi:hypothetical protein